MNTLVDRLYRWRQDYGYLLTEPEALLTFTVVLLFPWLAHPTWRLHLAWWQTFHGRPRGLVWYLVAIVYSLVVPFIAGDLLTFVSVGIFSAVIWVDWADPVHLAIDLGAVAFACALVFAGKMLWFRHDSLKLIAALVVLSACGLSVSDHLRSDKQLHPADHAMGVSSPFKVGLALSGGGYRAALFHAGVLDGLSSFGIPVSSIATVSGGSIMGSAYWERIEPAEFVDAVVAGKFNLWRKLMDIQFLSGYALFIPGDARRRAHERVLEETFLGSRTVWDLSREDQDTRFRPNLMIISTDLTNGAAVGIASHGNLIRQTVYPLMPQSLYENPPQFRSPLVRFFVTDSKTWPGKERLSTIVAASGAFPGAFEPYNVVSQVDRRTWRVPTLADGGITDNSALTLLLDADLLARVCGGDVHARLSGWKLDMVIASDGGRAYSASKSLFSVVEGAFRAIDTSYARATPRPLYFERQGVHSKPPPTILLSPSTLHSWGRQAPLFIADQLGAVAACEGDDALTVLSRIRDVLRGRPGPVGRESNRVETVSACRAATAPIDGHAINQLIGEILADPIFTEQRKDARAFADAPTLSADYDHDTAYRIYRLGWFLVALNSPELKKHLSVTTSSEVPSVRDGAGFCPPYFGDPDWEF